MKKDDAQRTVKEIWSLAAEAEAQAAEAQALAAATRARARATRLRRQAKIANGPVVGMAKGDAKNSYARRGAAATKVDTEGSVAVDEVASAQRAEPALSAQRRQARPPRPRLKAVATVLAVFVVLFSVGACVEISVLHRTATRQRQQVAEFSAAARRGVVTLTSLDFEHARADVQRILDVSTGPFKDEFAKMADDFTRSVEESEVISQGSVHAAAVELDSMTENSAVVLVASTSEITNAAGVRQDPRKYRLIVTMTREGKVLKMSKVEFLR